jgi:CDGSH-type Zn-finger protein
LEKATIKVRLNGPYLVQGPVVLKDADGNQFEFPGDNFVLCRCGGSNNKPFCDGTHQQIGFQAETRAN